MGIENKNSKSLYENLSELNGTVQRVIGHGSPEEHIIEVTPHAGIISIKELDGSGKLISNWEMGEDSLMREIPTDSAAVESSKKKTMGEKEIHANVERMLANLASYESRMQQQ